jgi:23S rRNA pseudouridine1911/1915/1917 synthase
MKYKIKKTADLLETVMEIYHGISKQKAKQIIGYADFILDGKKIGNDPRQIINQGQEIELIKVDKKQIKNAMPNRNNPVSIYFEDEFLIVALKPAGILSVGDQFQKNSKSFHKLLEAYLYQRDEKKRRLWIIHRLDKEVEGLIIFAKNELLQIEMKDNWQTVVKKYLALTEHKPQVEKGFIENWLKDGHDQKVIAYPKEVKGSKFAKTEYQYLKAENKFHLMEVILHTGRKNQIRVHLSEIGCPIVGDRKYGAEGTIKRQVRLAAYKLEFNHPVTKENILLEYKPATRFFKPSQSEDENYKII